MKIGELSKRSGVCVGTIRFYERRRLLKAPPRTPSGYRCYITQDVKIVRGIKQLQELGFTLREVKELLDLHSTTSACAMARSAEPRSVQRMIALTREKLLVIEKKSRMLSQMRREVARMLRLLQTSAAKACPVAREMSETPRCPGH